MPPTVWSLAITTLVVFSHVPAQQEPRSPAAPAPESAATTVIGCLARSATGDGFELIPVGAPAGTPGSTVTTPAPGTSATGTAPSGSVSGETPTGSTATTTAAPTPAVGEPGATANPASPTYNRPSSSTDTAGSVARPDTSPMSVMTERYTLTAGADVNLASHVGHTVELSGRAERHDAGASGATSSADRSAAPRRTLRVERLKHVAAECPGRAR
jgi:hypothetical protein